jgi:hypothetical protein
LVMAGPKRTLVQSGGILPLWVIHRHRHDPAARPLFVPGLATLRDAEGKTQLGDVAPRNGHFQFLDSPRAAVQAGLALKAGDRSRRDSLRVMVPAEVLARLMPL